MQEYLWHNVFRAQVWPGEQQVKLKGAVQKLLMSAPLAVRRAGLKINTDGLGGNMVADTAYTDTLYPQIH